MGPRYNGRKDHRKIDLTDFQVDFRINLGLRLYGGNKNKVYKSDTLLYNIGEE